jgi:hypothetical protein
MNVSALDDAAARPDATTRDEQPAEPLVAEAAH